MKLLLVLLLVLAAGCSPSYKVKSDRWEHAIKLCSTNGGVSFMRVTSNTAAKINCENGAVFHQWTQNDGFTLRPLTGAEE